eukprot:GHVT01009689.1.p1 GENE.GHVT01009689.1~~GHVT01009689.1.p1  ORF type:complete len:682 (+),score=90.91 GHVT01009689.1:285-2330(+)
MEYFASYAPGAAGDQNSEDELSAAVKSPISASSSSDSSGSSSNAVVSVTSVRMPAVDCAPSVSTLALEAAQEKFACSLVSGSSSLHSAGSSAASVRLPASVSATGTAPAADPYSVRPSVRRDATKNLQLFSNPQAGSTQGPILGPLTPHQVDRGGFARQHYNMLSGHVEQCVVGDIAFQEQYHQYATTGEALDPSDFSSRPDGKAVAIGIVGSQKTAAAIRREEAAGKGEQDAEEKGSDSSEIATSRSQRKARRVASGDPSGSYLGPWAPYVAEEEAKAKLAEEKAARALAVAKEAAAKAAEEAEAGVTEGTDKDKHPDESSTPSAGAPAAAGGDSGVVTTIFHGKSLVDYQGRSWLAPPKGLKEASSLTEEDMKCYLPKKCVHSFIGHTGAVHRIEFFPKTGHLLFSASMDSTVKVWDVHNQRACKRTYMGHTHAVRDIALTHDASKFYTASYDNNIIQWDTEYGKIIGTYTNGKTPYCVAVHPSEGSEHIFVIGSSNKRAVQFDSRSGAVTLEYNEHLASVNTVTFCEEGRKLVTTSDDKKMFVWDYNIPVVVKHIADPSMHSMPAVRLSPSGKFLACQSMDNQIVIYEGGGRFRIQSRKFFKGHINAGYAIRPAFSTDGKWILSGDGSGKIWFWNWKTLKCIRTLQAHDNVCIDAEWHPVDQSKIATCGWDGVVKLWD